jgi:transposase
MTSTKYIGMDVHKESISIAVRNAAGKIVMECVIETKASMILQFIDGLRGDLQVTFEEGTSAAWLYDLLKPHVTKLVVCDPRKNKSMREGNQSDKIDARRLAELLRLDHLTPVYHGEHGPTNAERVGAQLSDRDERSRTGDEPGESHLSQLGHSLYRQAGVCPSASGRVAREDQRTGSASAG